jgi:hypothetical protein
LTGADQVRFYRIEGNRLTSTTAINKNQEVVARDEQSPSLRRRHRGFPGKVPALLGLGDCGQWIARRPPDAPSVMPDFVNQSEPDGDRATFEGCISR